MVHKIVGGGVWAGFHHFNMPQRRYGVSAVSHRFLGGYCLGVNGNRAAKLYCFPSQKINCWHYMSLPRCGNGNTRAHTLLTNDCRGKGRCA